MQSAVHDINAIAESAIGNETGRVEAEAGITVEARQLDALLRIDLLDTGSEPGFDAIARMAAKLCCVPIARVNLIDAERMWNNAEQAFCAQTVLHREVLEIPDTALDARFAANPLVVGGPKIRFYAGAPLITHDGHAVGSLCVMDTSPHRLGEAKRERLMMLAEVVVEMLETRLLVPRAAEHRMRALAAAVDYAGTPLLVFTALAAGDVPTCSYANLTFLENFSFQPAHVIGRTPEEIFGRPERTAGAANGEAASGPDATTRCEATLRDGAGSARAVDVHMRWIPSDDGGAASLVATFRDVTHERAVRVELTQQAERMRALYLISSLRDLTGYRHVSSVIELGLKSLGLDYGFVAQCDAVNATILHAVGERRIYEAGAIIPLDETWMRHALAANDVHAFDSIADTSAGPRDARAYLGWGPYVVVPIVAGGGFRGALGFVGTAARSIIFSEADREFVRLMGTFVGPSLERKLQKDKLDALAFYDSLTGLPNRAMLFDRIDQAIALARSEGASVFALHYLDLDGFKEVNDSRGHAAGDAVLQHVAGRLKRVVRESDTVARLGGDEFVVVQRAARIEDAEILASHLVDGLRTPFVTRDGTFALGASIGIALYPRDGADADALLAAADRALYGVKSRAKGTAALAQPHEPRSAAGA